MDELTQAYASLGKKQTELEQLRIAHGNLLAFLGAVVTGQMARSRVLVNLTEGTWSWAAEGQSPGMPATINGLPVCLVAPPEEPPPVDCSPEVHPADKALEG